MKKPQQTLEPAEVFGMRVRQARKARGWSLRELAARLADADLQRPIDAGQLSLLERGSTTAPLETVFALSAALAVAPVNLMAPLDDETVVAVTKARPVTAIELRRWIKGGFPPSAWPMDDEDKRSYSSQKSLGEKLKSAWHAWDAGVIDDDTYEDIVAGIRSDEPPWPADVTENRRAEIRAWGERERQRQQKEDDNG